MGEESPKQREVHVSWLQTCMAGNKGNRQATLQNRRKGGGSERGGSVRFTTGRTTGGG